MLATRASPLRHGGSSRGAARGRSLRAPVVLHPPALRATEEDELLAVEEAELEASNALLQAQGGDSTRAGVAAILAAAAGEGGVISPKSAEIAAALQDMGALAASELDVLARAAELLKQVGFKGLPLSGAVGEEGVEEEEEED